jgi:hypothetical protein
MEKRNMANKEIFCCLIPCHKNKLAAAKVIYPKVTSYPSLALKTVQGRIANNKLPIILVDEFLKILKFLINK